MKTAIISDIHLGSFVCESKKLLKFLNSINTLKIEKLIINGDLFDNLDFRRLPKTHWKILSTLRKLSKKIKTIWIRGNHDGEIEILSHLIGIDFKDSYEFESGNKAVVCLHGDQFDKFIAKYPKTSKIADFLYRTIQRFDKKFIPNFIKRKSKMYIKCYENSLFSAINYAKQKNKEIICLGHTHKATIHKEDSIYYCNSGCWTDNNCSYLIINDGNIELFWA